MAIARKPKIIVTFAAVGALIALTICVIGQFVLFNPYWVSYAVLATCPPSLMLMATEGCNGSLSWCSIQIVLLVILFNAILYAAIGAIFALLIRRASGIHRGAA